MNWQPLAATLADDVTNRTSRWRTPVATTPRHLFVPHWWTREDDGWQPHDGPADEQQWLAAAYRDTSLVTSVGRLHADHAKPDDHPTGLPTSSSTLPGLVVRMLQHARLDDDDQLLDVGTGSGYGAGLAAARLGDARVTSIDVDPYLVEAARERLAGIGRHPLVRTVDATGELPGLYDRIVATVAVRPIPASWLGALKPGGRLVTTITGTSLIITAEKQQDGGAVGRVEWDRAGFMHARHGDDYPPGLSELLDTAREQDGEDITVGQYPVVNVAEAWDLASMLDVTAPGIEHHYAETDGQCTALMAHADGSWVRATAYGDQPPTVHQGGPRSLLDILDEIRSYWLRHGELPVRGAKVFVTPDGTTHLARGSWHVTL